MGDDLRGRFRKIRENFGGSVPCLAGKNEIRFFICFGERISVSRNNLARLGSQN